MAQTGTALAGMVEMTIAGSVTEVVVECSGNHGGELANALRLIDCAKDVGADAVKFQCFSPERLAARRSTRADVLALAGGVPLIALYRRIHTPQAWFPDLIRQAESCGLRWFSSVFSPDDVAFLETQGCPRYKISAFEMLDWELIKAVKDTGKPIVMSVRPTKDVIVLHATNYDGSVSPLGLSDHGCDRIPENVPMIEWHMKLPGVETPDSDFSLTPDVMKLKIEQIRLGTMG